MKYKKSHRIDDLVIASLCHDLIEDAGVSADEIKDKFGRS